MLTVSRRTKIYAVHYLDDSLVTVYAVLTVRSEVVSLNAAENPHTCSYSTETSFNAKFYWFAYLLYLAKQVCIFYVFKYRT